MQAQSLFNFAEPAGQAPAAGLSLLRRNRFPASCQVCGARIPAFGGIMAGTKEARLFFCQDHKPAGQVEAANALKPIKSAPKAPKAPKAAPAAPAGPAIDVEGLTRLATDAAAFAARSALASIPALVADELAKIAPRTIEVKAPGKAAVKIDRAHPLFERVLRVVTAGQRPFLVGPAGSGKSTLARQVAKALGLKFYMGAAVQDSFTLMGFENMAGNMVRSPFREAYEHGGVFLLDEMDAGEPGAYMCINDAMANGHCQFQDALVSKHPDFILIAAANTFGRGASLEYVGTNQLNAATLDRFYFMVMEYDQDLETDLGSNAAWTLRVQAIRAAVESSGVQLIVSPRATIEGAKALAAGEPQVDVEEALIWRGLDTTNRARVVAAIGA